MRESVSQSFEESFESKESEGQHEVEDSTIEPHEEATHFVLGEGFHTAFDGLHRARERELAAVGLGLLDSFPEFIDDFNVPDHG